VTDERSPEEPTTYVSIDQELRARIANEQALADLPGRGVAVPATSMPRRLILWITGPGNIPNAKLNMEAPVSSEAAS
jgi:hypothetical protein